MPTQFPEVGAALDKLAALYAASVANLRQAIQSYVDTRVAPTP